MTVNYKFKIKPFDHQITALERGWQRPEFGLFMEMGTGKSKVLIDNLGMLYQRRGDKLCFDHRAKGCV